MDSKLRILMLEDVPDDAELTERELRGGGISFLSRMVDTRAGFVEGIEALKPALILADYKLPTFDGLSALAIAKDKCPEVPFIFVTGAMGEEWAIETLKKGATDYVLKDSLSRLVPAVKRALREAEEHRERNKAETALKRTTEQLRNIFDNIDAVLFSIDHYGNRMLQISPACERICGLPQSAFFENPHLWIEIIHPDDRIGVEGRMRHLYAGKTVEAEYRVVLPEGDIRWVRGKVNPAMDSSGNLVRLDGFLYDITERKTMVEALQQSERLKKIMNRIFNVFLTMSDEEVYGEVLKVVLDVMESRSGLFGFIADNGDLVIPTMTREVWSECQVPDKSLVFPPHTWGGSRWGRAIREKKGAPFQWPFPDPGGSHSHQ